MSILKRGFGRLKAGSNQSKAKINYMTGEEVPTEKERLMQMYDTFTQSVEPETSKQVQASRVGTSIVAAHLPDNVRQQLKILAAEQNKTIQHCLGEALSDYSAKQEKPTISFKIEP